MSHQHRLLGGLFSFAMVYSLIYWISVDWRMPTDDSHPLRGDILSSPQGLLLSRVRKSIEAKSKHHAKQPHIDRAACTHRHY